MQIWLPDSLITKIKAMKNFWNPDLTCSWNLHPQLHVCTCMHFITAHSTQVWLHFWWSGWFSSLAFTMCLWWTYHALGHYTSSYWLSSILNVGQCFFLFLFLFLFYLLPLSLFMSALSLQTSIGYTTRWRSLWDIHNWGPQVRGCVYRRDQHRVV